MERRVLRSESSSALSCSPYNRKITFARLATCVLNVERALKKSTRVCREEELLEASETGDIQKLRRLLEGNVEINIEYTDQLGRTPLHLAVVNEHKEAVRYLLDHVDRRRVYQALLSAINIGNEEIAEIIIEHPKYAEISNDLKTKGRAFFYENKFNDDGQFSEEVTPLILASQQNRFEVVLALLLKRDTIEKPHRSHCSCADCTEQASRDELKFARSRLNAYRGLASEAYISLSSDDPILTSFKLRKELQQVAKDEKYYAAEYSALATQLSEYTVKLLDKVHGNEELNAILNADDDGDYETSGELARLQLAIKYKEKRFVAHPSCQKKLTTLWYRDFYKLLKTRSDLLQTLAVLVIVIFYPLLSIVYIFAPNSVVAKLLKTPCMKFVAHAASYLFFLFLIVINGQVEQGKLCQERIIHHDLLQKHFHFMRENLTTNMSNFANVCIRNYRPAAMEVCILLWISGMLWQACKQIYRVGGHAHFMNIYNAMDFFMLQFYMASFALKRLTERKVRTSLSYFKHHDSWSKLSASDPEAIYRLYWLDSDRYYWNSLDPVHVCEALFAVGNIINFARLFHLLAINEHLGPMLISLERMVKDVMKFMVTFVPLFLAFMVGMYNLYWYYDPSVRKTVELKDHGIKTKAQEGFGNLELTFRTIFWALFGLKDARTVELGEGFDSRFTESVGYIVFGVYNWGAVIVLLNMLIAMMTRSFDKIATDQDIEWKFVRSKLYMEYINHGSTLPVPFNIFPTPKLLSRSLAAGLDACKRRLRRSKQEKNTSHKISDKTERSSAQLFQKSQQESSVFSDSEMVPDPELGATPPVTAQTETTPNTLPLSGRRSTSVFKRPASSAVEPSVFGASIINGDDESKSVIKNVVRRYIFERLLASVVPNEGSNDGDVLKQQLASVQEELQSVKPKIFEQFATISKEFIFLQKTMGDIRGSLAVLSKAFKDNPHKPTQSQSNSQTNVADDDIAYSLKCDVTTARKPEIDLFNDKKSLTCLARNSPLKSPFKHPNRLNPVVGLHRQNATDKQDLSRETDIKFTF